MSKAKQSSITDSPGVKDVLIKDREVEIVKFKVVFVRFPFISSYGGEEKHTLEIANYYKKQGARVSFVGSCRVLLEMFDNAGFEIAKKWLFKPPVTLWRMIWFSLLSPVLFVKGLIDVAYLKLKYGNELRLYILGFGEKLIWGPWACFFGVKSLWLEHQRFGNWFHKNPWKLWYKFWSIHKNVKVITVSELMRQEIGIDWVKVIVNAVNGSKYKKNSDTNTSVNGLKKVLSKNKTNIGFIGRFTKDKGIDIVVKIAKEFPEIGFICCGDGIMKQDLDKAKIDNMLLDPELVPYFLQNIELLVTPSTLSDPFALVVLEAMHAGTPVLLSDRCGVAFYLQDGIHAFICKSDEFVEKFRQIMEKKSVLKKVTSNLPSALQEFSYKKMLHKYWEELTVW